MKRLLAVIALALMPVMGIAQDNVKDRLFADETGHFTMVVDMGALKVLSECWFMDYGARQRNEMEIMGEKVITLKINGMSYLIAPQFQEVPDDEVVNFNNLTPEVMEKHDIKKAGSEKIDGYDCDIYTFQKSQQGVVANAKVWIWHGLPIRTEVGTVGFTVVQTISNLEVGVPVDPALFELPENGKVQGQENKSGMKHQY